MCAVHARQSVSHARLSCAVGRQVLVEHPFCWNSLCKTALHQFCSSSPCSIVSATPDQVAAALHQGSGKMVHWPTSAILHTEQAS